MDFPGDFKALISLALRKVFKYNKYYIFRKNLGENEGNRTPPENMQVHVASNREDFAELLNQGYTVDSPPFSIDTIEKRLAELQVYFGIYHNKRLVHNSWIVLSDPGNTEPPVHVRYNEEGYIHYSLTIPEYQGMGLFSFALTEICSYLKEMGRLRAKIAIETGNYPSLSAARNAGFEICDKGHFLKILSIPLWYEYPHYDNNQS